MQFKNNYKYFTINFAKKGENNMKIIKPINYLTLTLTVL